jgi:hypothetical protein
MTLETIALRAFAETKTAKASRRAGKASKPRRFLVLDTETTTDAAQALLFGSYRYGRIAWNGEVPTVSCVEEGFFYADALPEKHAEWFAILEQYCAAHSANVSAAYSKGLEVPLQLHSRREFLKKILYPAAYQGRALVVGFNLPFDLSRLAFSWSVSRGLFTGGFSLGLWDYEKEGKQLENRYRPRVVVKSIDSKRALKGFAGEYSRDEVDMIPEGKTEPDSSYFFRGHFLDLRTLAFVLTDHGHSLESACEAFGVEHGKTKAEKHGEITPAYIAYNRRDVQATTELLEKTLAEYYRHPVDLQPTKAYSPASLGKAYLRAMGIRPVLERQPGFLKKVLGYAMNAYFGGRAECRIRRQAVPVAYTDFTSMYPTVNALMGNWELLTARHIRVDDAQADVEQLMTSVSADDCFSPKFWPQLRVLVKIRPSGQPLPTRAKYDHRNQAWQIGINKLTSSRPVWVALPDLIAAKLLGGETPEILEALRLVPEGRQAGLKEVKLRGSVAVDPAKTDLFCKIIQERHKVRRQEDLEAEERDRLQSFLKVLANSTSYGVFAEFVRHELSGKRKQTVVVWNADGKTFESQTHAPEEPGEFSFPPLAALITAAARLMLALLEVRVGERGGSYAFCDTDSMAIVASEDGGLVPCPGGSHRTADGLAAVRALSWQGVDEIREQFAALNPYDPGVVPGSIIKIEDENFDESGARIPLMCYGISAKRYVLFYRSSQGQLLLPKCSEHGLGHLLNPYDPDSDEGDWIEEAWHDILAKDVLGTHPKAPRWWHDPALARLTISSPVLLEPFAGFNETRSFAEKVRPFNFMLSAQITDDVGLPLGLEDPQHFHLVTRYMRKPRQALKTTWFNRYDGKPYRVTVSSAPDLRGQARIATYGEILDDYRERPEHKSLAPDGTPCQGETAGLLGRRPVEAFRIAYVGKESNRLEEAQSGLLHDEQEAVNQYDDPGCSDFREYVLPVLAEMPLSALVSATGLHASTLKRIRADTSRPHADNEVRLTGLATEHARAWLRGRSLEVPREQVATLHRYLELQTSKEKPCPVCGKPVVGRHATYCSATCRQRAARSRANKT